MSLKGNAAPIAGITSVGSPALIWVNEHYLVLWLSISAFSAVTAVVFHILNLRETRKANNLLTED